MKIFAIPCFNKITGQSEISRIVSDIIKPDFIFVINDGIVSFIISLLKCLFKSPDCLYITISRTRFGSFRDFLIIYFLKPQKIISHIHGMGFNKNYFFLKRNIRKSDVIVLLTEDSKEIFKESFKNFNGEIQIIENPILNNYKITPKKNSLDFKLNIFYFSNLMVSKGINEFLNLAENFNKIYNFKVAGRNIDNIDLDNNFVKYYGVVKGIDKLNFINSNDIFIFYSSYGEEFYPLSLIEAVYHGKLCIVKKHNNLDITFSNLNIIWVNSFNDVLEIFKDEKSLKKQYLNHLKWFNKNINNIELRFSKESFEKKIKTLFFK